MGIESKPAANRLDELLECAEIDGIFVGPNDLTTSLGIPDEVDNPIYLDVLKNVIETGEKHGVPTMVHQQSIETSTKAIELGARFVLHSSEVGILLKGISKTTSLSYAISPPRDSAESKPAKPKTPSKRSRQPILPLRFSEGGAGAKQQRGMQGAEIAVVPATTVIPA